jgi:integrase
MATFVTLKSRKGTVYQAVIRKKGHKPIKRTFSTKGEAKFWAAEQESLILRKKYKDPRLAEAVYLEEALNRYHEYGKNILKKSPSTLDREQYSHRHITRILGAGTPLSEIGSTEISRYQSERLAENASSSSVRQELAMLSRMFRLANGAWGLSIDNPLTYIDRVPAGPGRERFLSTKEVRIILEEAKNTKNIKFYPFVLLLMHSGMRTGEAARITTSTVDIENRLITLWQTKSKKPRTIPLTVEVAEALKKIKPEVDGYIFLKPNHRLSKQIMLRPGCIFQDCWRRMWTRLHRKAADQENHPGFPIIPHFTPHDIRHTAASHLLMQGVDVRIIADILGHSTLAMIMRYTHLFDKTKREHIDKISYLGKEGEHE